MKWACLELPAAFACLGLLPEGRQIQFQFHFKARLTQRKARTENRCVLARADAKPAEQVPINDADVKFSDFRKDKERRFGL
jgi:hypothetical protein